MNRKCIMLIDDNPHDTFFNKRVIMKNNADDIIIAMESATSALAYLRSNTEPKPDLIFLDIYMPAMDGWEFIEEYRQLDPDLQIENIIVMLATSGDPAHIAKANELDCISDYVAKPLTEEKMAEITAKYLHIVPGHRVTA